MSESYYLALLVPIVVTGIFYYFKRHEFTWWEFFIPIGSVAIAIIISKLIIDTSSVKFTEYWGSSVTAVYEEEPYNVWHNETCSYTTTDGKGNSTTHYYDCSHQDDYGPEWYAKTNLGEKFSISEKQHDELVKQFRTKKVVIDSRRNHDANDRCVRSDGTKFEGREVGAISNVYQTLWSGDDETRKAYTSVHSYKNKIKASDLTIFNISLVTDEQADSLGLFKYPDHKGSRFFSTTNGLEYPTILGGNVDEKTQEYFRKLNGKFGVSNEMRLWVLVFENKPPSIARYQENYWVKGNMNELVICIGKKGDQIQWVHAFSWALSNELTIDVRNKVLDLYQYKDSVVKKDIPVISKAAKKLNLPIQSADTIVKIKSPNYPVLNTATWHELYDYLNQNLNRFKRRTFEEFDYLTVVPSKTAIIIIYILAFVISIGVNIWVTTNEFWDDNDTNWSNQR